MFFTTFYQMVFLSIMPFLYFCLLFGLHLRDTAVAHPVCKSVYGLTKQMAHSNILEVNEADLFYGFSKITQKSKFRHTGFVQFRLP